MVKTKAHVHNPQNCDPIPDGPLKSFPDSTIAETASTIHDLLHMGALFGDENRHANEWLERYRTDHGPIASCKTLMWLERTEADRAGDRLAIKEEIDE
jgi:hypothetical protein